MAIAMRHSIPFLIFLLAQLATGCASRAPYDPFFIPREEFQRTARTIVAAPVVGPSGIEVPDSLLLHIDTLIEDALVIAGYECVPANEYAAVWDRILDQMGGLYDAETGELDDLKLEVARDQLGQDLLEMYHPDYVLYPEIWIVEAESSGGVAKWDGVSQPLVGLGARVLNVFDALLNQYEGFLQPGVVDALSLEVVIETMDGVEVFENAVGIEVLKDADGDREGAELTQFEPVLADRTRNQRAVRTALLPLRERFAEGSPRA
jgi:hypothetical protein